MTRLSSGDEDRFLTTRFSSLTGRLLGLSLFLTATFFLLSSPLLCLEDFLKRKLMSLIAVKSWVNLLT